MAHYIAHRISIKLPWTEITMLTLTAVGLGLLMEVFLLAIRLTQTDTLPTSVVFLGGLLQQISWSVLICSALALATLLGESFSAPNALFSIVLTPVALIATKIIQKGISAALALPPGATEQHLATLFIGRTFEYTLLNMLLFSLKLRGHLEFWKFFAAGTSVSILIGLPIGLQMANGSTFAADQLGTIFNEVGWPILCACFAHATARLHDAVKH